MVETPVKETVAAQLFLALLEDKPVLFHGVLDVLGEDSLVFTQMLLITFHGSERLLE